MTLISDSQNSVSPKAFTENILIKKMNVRNIKLQVKGLNTLNTSQNCKTFEATMTSTLVTSDHIPNKANP